MFPRAIKTNKLPPYLRGNGLKQKYFAQLFTIEMYLHILPRCELFIISPIYGKFHNCISIYLKTYFFILGGDFFAHFTYYFAHFSYFWFDFWGKKWQPKFSKNSLLYGWMRGVVRPIMDGKFHNLYLMKASLIYF